MRRDHSRAKHRAVNYPLDALWQAPAIFWIALTGVAVAAVLALAPGVGSDRWIYFGLTLLVIQWIAVLTLAGLFVLRRPLGRIRPPQVAYVAVLLLLLNTWLKAPVSPPKMVPVVKVGKALDATPPS